MNIGTTFTQRLKLAPQTRDDVREQVEQMSPDERANLSKTWLELLDRSSAVDPWVHGFILHHRSDGRVIGKCGFNGPPSAEGIVEIAYFVAPEHRGNGYATEAAQGLVSLAFADSRVRIVRAHTLPEANASGRVLSKCGFQHVGDVVDPQDGRVWRWERERAAVGCI